MIFNIKKREKFSNVCHFFIQENKTKTIHWAKYYIKLEKYDVWMEQ